jgi:serine/threonine-protein kinase RsbW
MPLLTGAGWSAAPSESTYAAVPASVSVARKSVSRWLRDFTTDEVMIGDIALAVSEACTNAVVHGRSNGAKGTFGVLAEIFAGAVRVTVTDDGEGMSPRSDSPGLGLGLPLMATLSDALEVDVGPGGVGTAVAMSFRPR